MYLVPLALPVMIITSLYIVSATAFLTGLRPNSSLYNIPILIKFNLFSVVPLIFITMSSRLVKNHFPLAILAIIVTLPASLFLPEIWDRIGEDLFVFGLFAFVVASIRRVYQTTVLGALVRAVFVTVMYFIVTLMVITGGVAYLSAGG